jgi:hypothetical protein
MDLTALAKCCSYALLSLCDDNFRQAFTRDMRKKTVGAYRFLSPYFSIDIRIESIAPALRTL